MVHVEINEQQIKKKNLETPPIIKEFQDVFLEEILGLPPHRDIGISIELVLGATPVSRAPYRMSIPKLLELNMQLQELIDK